MFRRTFSCLALALALLCELNASDAETSGGTVISNTATATYQANTTTYGIVSNTVQTTVAAVGSLIVTPKENGCNPQTDSFPIGEPLVRSFSIANTSNITDAYTIQAASTSAGSITSIDFMGSNGPIPVVVGQTVSPNVNPGASIGVQVTVATGGISPGTDVIIRLTAQTTVLGTINGLQSDSGDACGIAAAGAVFGGPQGANQPVSKLVDLEPVLQAQPNTVVHYSVSFRNYGGAAANNTTLTDPIPVGVTPNTSAVIFNGAPLPSSAYTFKGQTLTANLGSIPPQQLQTVAFDATVSSNVTLGASYVNVATLTAGNAPQAVSAPATILVGTGEIVFDGNAGANAPISSATLTLVNPGTQTPAGVARLRNPFVTPSSGTYQFPLPPGSFGAKGSSVAYDLLVTASGYVTRRIHLVLTPDATQTVYSVTTTAPDGAPLATAGGFALVPGPVSLVDVYGFFGNIPLFAQHALTITKTSDRSVTSTGDRVIWTVQFAPASATTFGATTVVDALPSGLTYAPGTARLDGAASEPAVSGGTLTWNLPTLAASHTIAYATVVGSGLADGTSLTNVATVTARAPNNPRVSASANASVAVTSGVFSAREVILGRVYLDMAGTGRFVARDPGVAGVRVYLEDGESVVTDSDGRYSFPAARPGMHVLRIDPQTLPPRVGFYPSRAYDDERSPRRLVHGLFDSGTMFSIDFALRLTS